MLSEIVKVVVRKNVWFVGKLFGLSEKNFGLSEKYCPWPPPPKKKHGTHSATVFNKYKTFSVLIYTVISTRVEIGKTTFSD
jgi:hypothetical protein